MENNSTNHGKYAINGSRNEMGGNGFSLRALAPVNHLGFQLTSEPSSYQKETTITANCAVMDVNGALLGGCPSGRLASTKLERNGAVTGGFVRWTDANGIERARMVKRRRQMKFDNGYRK
ncbi:hypothetical protein UFOVP1292_54 [uncultured Caudovirales phage]|uniref:Uncharacterized protein n=1 Tax=uncultured Caudovirales phage TaxID=2100421 RepID=A0A6J5RFX9_9CAUD|nr:hypothetical protein UFOVP859_41 [uncultured Caudovirales phage]CAB4168501.1 hypothetical protein UFOVP882_38 [uncultured Caudovirales phage]CAB4196450.1 hypothetical protein UFOVP1292_54 [uncultured Caudovirales phage]CAB4205224.1 hypothetical protein UFOVP1411_45 [uncultured Caudovirales phage]